MPTTFNVIALGQHTQIDKLDGDYNAERAYKLNGKEFGGAHDPLYDHIAQMTPAEDKDAGGDTPHYDQDGSENNGFHIDGGTAQVFAAVAVYDATLIYSDGTTAEISAVIFQDINGQTYLAPEMSENADQSALEAKPITALKLNALFDSHSLGLAEDRAAGLFKAPCFAAGTRLSVPGGARKVEGLRVGDLVETADHGPQPVRWIGGRVVPAAGAAGPIAIAPGALGEGLPRADLVVSPQHRVLVASAVASRMTGQAQVLVPAKQLLGLPGIRRLKPRLAIRYVHLLFDRHEIVFAEGAPTESLFLGPQADALLPGVAVRALRERFATAATPARLMPKGHVIRSLVARHRSNGKPLLQARQWV